MKTGMTDAQAASWAVVRARGRLRYVVMNGVLGWGMTTALIWSGVMWANSPQRTLADLLLYLGIALVGFPLGGFVWGAWMWRCMERRYVSRQAERAA